MSSPRLSIHLLVRLFVFSVLLLLAAGCATSGSSLERESGVLTSSNAFRIKTTAYTGSRNAVGRRLSNSGVVSAASDWSQFPLDTKFRIRETGGTYVIDDYGSALVGTRTIDLCMSGNRSMHAWGVRWVHIDILEWGSPRRSLEVLAPREGNRHVRKMIYALRHQTKGLPVEFRKVEP